MSSLPLPLSALAAGACALHTRTPRVAFTSTAAALATTRTRRLAPIPVMTTLARTPADQTLAAGTPCSGSPRRLQPDTLSSPTPWGPKHSSGPTGPSRSCIGASRMRPPGRSSRTCLSFGSSLQSWKPRLTQPSALLAVQLDSMPCSSASPPCSTSSWIRGMLRPSGCA